MRVLPNRLRALVLSLGAFALLGLITADGQTAVPDASAPAATASHATAPNQTTSPAIAPNNEILVLDHVNHVLQWSRLWGGADAYAVVPGDELFVENGQDIARKVVNLEFKSALAQAALLAESTSKPAPTPDSARGRCEFAEPSKVAAKCR